MPGDFTILPMVGFLIVADAVFLYGAYLALSVWRGLVVPIYRSRAAWMALVGIPLALAVSYDTVVSTFIPGSLLAHRIFIETLFTVPLITLLVWIDRTVNSLVRLDFLRRDILHWKRLRPAYWTTFIIANVLFFSRYVFPNAYVYATSTTLTLVALFYGSLCLARGARTTRDMTFRSHAKWFGVMGGVFAVAMLQYVLAEGINVLSLALLVVVSYSFYRMARFLVPAGKLSSDSVASAEAPTQ